MLLDHTEELRGVRGAHRLPLVNHRRVPGKDGQLGVCLFVTYTITHQFVHTLPAGASSRCTHGQLSSPGRRQPTRSLQVAPGSRKKNRVKKERKKVAPRRSPPSSTCSPLRALPPGAGHPSAGLACVVRMCKHFLPPSTKLLARLDHPFQHPKNSSKAWQCFYKPFLISINHYQPTAINL